MFPRRRESYPQEMTQPRNSVVGRLRAKLSHACVDALQPDLIIMDEFQRFRDLLCGDSDAAILARELFRYSDLNGQVGTHTFAVRHPVSHADPIGRRARRR